MKPRFKKGEVVRVMGTNRTGKVLRSLMGGPSGEDEVMLYDIEFPDGAVIQKAEAELEPAGLPKTFASRITAAIRNAVKYANIAASRDTTSNLDEGLQSEVGEWLDKWKVKPNEYEWDMTGKHPVLHVTTNQRGTAISKMLNMMRSKFKTTVKVKDMSSREAMFGPVDVIFKPPQPKKSKKSNVISWVKVKKESIDEAKKEITASDVAKIDKVDYKKVQKKFPVYARTEDLSLGKGQGKRVKGMVKGGMATVGLKVTIRDYGAQFKVSGEDLEELKSMSTDFSGATLLTHYAKARYAGYTHGQAAAYAWMKGDREPPQEIAKAMNQNESIDEGTDTEKAVLQILKSKLRVDPDDVEKLAMDAAKKLHVKVTGFKELGAYYLADLDDKLVKDQKLKVRFRSAMKGIFGNGNVRVAVVGESIDEAKDSWKQAQFVISKTGTGYSTKWVGNVNITKREGEKLDTWSEGYPWTDYPVTLDLLQDEMEEYALNNGYKYLRNHNVTGTLKDGSPSALLSWEGEDSSEEERREAEEEVARFAREFVKQFKGLKAERSTAVDSHGGHWLSVEVALPKKLPTKLRLGNSYGALGWRQKWMWQRPEIQKLVKALMADMKKKGYKILKTKVEESIDEDFRQRIADAARMAKLTKGVALRIWQAIKDTASAASGAIDPKKVAKVAKVATGDVQAFRSAYAALKTALAHEDVTMRFTVPVSDDANTETEFDQVFERTCESMGIEAGHPEVREGAWYYDITAPAPQAEALVAALKESNVWYQSEAYVDIAEEDAPPPEKPLPPKPLKTQKAALVVAAKALLKAGAKPEKVIRSGVQHKMMGGGAPKIVAKTKDTFLTIAKKILSQQGWSQAGTYTDKEVFRFTDVKGHGVRLTLSKDSVGKVRVDVMAEGIEEVEVDYEKLSTEEIIKSLLVSRGPVLTAGTVADLTGIPPLEVERAMGQLNWTRLAGKMVDYNPSCPMYSPGDPEPRPRNPRDSYVALKTQSSMQSTPNRDGMNEPSDVAKVASGVMHMQQASWVDML
jgi:hypothetical protein